jgi:hypothetical protein
MLTGRCYLVNPVNPVNPAKAHCTADEISIYNGDVDFIVCICKQTHYFDTYEIQDTSAGQPAFIVPSASTCVLQFNACQEADPSPPVQKNRGFIETIFAYFRPSFYYPSVNSSTVLLSIVRLFYNQSFLAQRSKPRQNSKLSKENMISHSFRQRY